MVIYETINLINGKRYIGKDTHNDNSYLGSGRILSKAIKKYGVENFKKVILESCNSIEELNDREKYWIKITNAQVSEMYYNVGAGGEGGDNITHNPNRDKFIKKMTEINNDLQYTRTRNGHKDSTKENQKLAAKGRFTLIWFKERYGDDDGAQKYETRRQALKNRNYSKFRDPITGKFSKA